MSFSLTRSGTTPGLSLAPYHFTHTPSVKASHKAKTKVKGWEGPLDPLGSYSKREASRI